MPSRARIQCECAFTYMNAVSGKNLTAVFSSMEVDAGMAHDIRRRTPQCQGRSAVLPDDSDMHLGRERPPKTRPGTVIGGWQRGSLTPQMPPSLLPDSRADCDTGGKERRPIDRGEVADRKEHRHFTH